MDNMHCIVQCGRSIVLVAPSLRYTVWFCDHKQMVKTTKATATSNIRVQVRRAQRRSLTHGTACDGVTFLLTYLLRSLIPHGA